MQVVSFSFCLQSGNVQLKLETEKLEEQRLFIIVVLEPFKMERDFT